MSEMQRTLNMLVQGKGNEESMYIPTYKSDNKYLVTPSIGVFSQEWKMGKGESLVTCWEESCGWETRKRPVLLTKKSRKGKKKTQERNIPSGSPSRRGGGISVNRAHSDE